MKKEIKYEVGDTIVYDNLFPLPDKWRYSVTKIVEIDGGLITITGGSIITSGLIEGVL